jgi:hypothetical protein
MPAPFDFDDDDAVERALEEQLQAFRAKFGRDPGPEDPLFFDPDADEPRPLNRVAIEAGMVAAMERTGVSRHRSMPSSRPGSSLSKASWTACPPSGSRSSILPCDATSDCT